MIGALPARAVWRGDCLAITKLGRGATEAEFRTADVEGTVCGLRPLQPPAWVTLRFGVAFTGAVSRRTEGRPHAADPRTRGRVAVRDVSYMIPDKGDGRGRTGDRSNPVCMAWSESKCNLACSVQEWEK